MKLVVNIFLASLLTVSGIAQTINSNKSEVTFEIGNLGFNTVEGSFKKMTGDIMFKPSELTSANFNVCIDASTINTKNKKRDDHLKNEDFFDVKEYPSICFQSETVIKEGDKYLTRGKLTMHGVTKQVEIPFNFSSKIFTGTLTVNRYDYNIGSQTSKFMVSEEAEIKIVCVLD